MAPVAGLASCQPLAPGLQRGRIYSISCQPYLHDHGIPYPFMIYCMSSSRMKDAFCSSLLMVGFSGQVNIINRCDPHSPHFGMVSLWLYGQVQKWVDMVMVRQRRINKLVIDEQRILSRFIQGTYFGFGPADRKWHPFPRQLLHYLKRFRPFFGDVEDIYQSFISGKPF